MPNLNHVDDVTTDAGLLSILEAIPGFISLVDREHRLIFTNRLVAGLTMEQVVGTSVYAFIPPEFHDAARQALEETWRTGKPTTYLVKATSDHGTLGWYLTSLSAVMRGGEFVAVLLMSQDVTQQKQAEEAQATIEARFRAAIDAALDVFAVLTCERDASGMVVDFLIEDVNAGATAFVNLPREAIVGRRISEVLPHVRSDGLFDKYLRVVTTQTPLAEEQKLTMPDGTTRWTSHRMVPLADGVALTSKNITATKQLEIDLRNALSEQQRYAEALEEKNKQLLAVSAPIIQAWEGVLALPVIGTLGSVRVEQITEKLLGEIVRTGSRFVILDLTGVDAADASTVDQLLRIVRAVGLLGSRCLVSGISPAVAQTMVEAAPSREDFTTFGLLQDALRFALKSSGALHRNG